MFILLISHFSGTCYSIVSRHDIRCVLLASFSEINDDIISSTKKRKTDGSIWPLDVHICSVLADQYSSVPRTNEHYRICFWGACPVISRTWTIEPEDKFLNLLAANGSFDEGKRKKKKLFCFGRGTNAPREENNSNLYTRERERGSAYKRHLSFLCIGSERRRKRMFQSLSLSLALWISHTHEFFSDI